MGFPVSSVSTSTFFETKPSTGWGNLAHPSFSNFLANVRRLCASTLRSSCLFMVSANCLQVSPRLRISKLANWSIPQANRERSSMSVRTSRSTWGWIIFTATQISPCPWFGSSGGSAARFMYPLNTCATEPAPSGFSSRRSLPLQAGPKASAMVRSTVPGAWCTSTSSCRRISLDTNLGGNRSGLVEAHWASLMKQGPSVCTAQIM
mmetsp:Transcript_29452/g.65322  ORF Transcript_29452/g.65322 Transcript_29452/m.65322 type:complete len:206 (-) Transcript_29452:574-1191(-)